MSTLVDQVRGALAAIADPLFSDNLVKLGYVKDVQESGDEVIVSLELPTPAHPHRFDLEAAVGEAIVKLGRTPKIDVSWQIVPRVLAGGRMAMVKNIIAVAAGKGGVGKSTVATNLALGLKRAGAKVGLLDADVYGPSVPTMMGPPEVPAAQEESGALRPGVHWGIEIMSVGFFVERDGAVVWRGPMIHKLLQQFLEDVRWGELDYLIVDLPPGTGDAQLSLSQLIPITGTVIVTTPQEISLVDVVKAVSMLQKVNVPVLGVVENMSLYRCPACGHTDEIFSRGGGKVLAKELGVEFLGELVIDPKVRYGGDTGRPVIVGAPDSENAQRFAQIARTVAGLLAKSAGPPSQAVKRPPGLVTIR